MKAIVFKRYGSPDGLQLKEVSKPIPADSEILIRVHASSVNSWDWEVLNGIPLINRLTCGLLKPRSTAQILGSDVAGTIAAIGKNVRRFSVGDEVFGDLWERRGAFAEYVCADETAVEPKPENVSFEDAAATPQAGVLALQAIQVAPPLQAGKKILINGAGGGVGTFAIQLAKRSGADVTGVEAAHKLETVLSVGADHVIDCAQEDFTNNGKQYDLVIDCQNFRSMSDNKRALRPDGVYAMVGGSMPRAFELWLFSLVAWLIRDSRKLRLVVAGPNKGLEYLKELLEDGKLIPTIDRTYPLCQVPEALRYFGEGHHEGKIVISVKN